MAEGKVKVQRGVVKDGDGVRHQKCNAKIKTYGNIWTRELHYEKAGEMKKGHKHEFDHLHFLAKGSVQISVYDKQDRDKVLFRKDYTAPAWIKVPKEHFHDIIALEDDTLGYCIQAVTEEDGTILKTDYALDEDWMEEVRKFEEENGQPDEELKE
jgi:hypothetical protein